MCVIKTKAFFSTFCLMTRIIFPLADQEADREMYQSADKSQIYQTSADRVQVQEKCKILRICL